MHKEVIHLLSNGKSWPVIYFQHSIEKPSLISGTDWRGFAMDNNLEVDDVCAFELIEGPKTSMKVTIYKMQAVEDSSTKVTISDDGSREKQVEPHGSLVIKNCRISIDEEERRYI
ncbi:hypothetical protein Goklo_027640 [Gossypium klotzschianum]|uniref:TF-B3 domain-containing protein n=2 Tax=Gossypium TaxID=3633 RepID=A0A7J8TYQ9_9ROSI|nr:hypothetical protein [Gossypium klotzschianum]